MIRDQSVNIYTKACEFIPGGVNSPVRSFLHLNMPPLIAESGKGGVIWDADGNRFIDLCCSWGALILGHSYDPVIEKVYQQMKKGTSFGIATEIEKTFAQEIVKLVPSIEKLRFLSSGTEATMTAIRLARAFTKRKKIIKFSGHYHGHSDALLIQAGSGVSQLNPQATSMGVNEGAISDTLCFKYNDIETLKRYFEGAQDVAAIILEPVCGNMGVVLPEDSFLSQLRALCTKNGSLLIFDEVITGFRLGLQGAQGYFQVQPDLTCLGKIIGGGFPVAAVGGRKEILDLLAPLGKVYQAGTLSGNPVAMRAGLETVRILQKDGFYSELQKKADRLIQPLKKAIENKNIALQSCGSMFNLFFGVKKVKSKEDLVHLDEKMFIRFFHFLFERGVYISPSSHEAWFVSMAHEDADLDYAKDAICEFINLES